MELENNIEAPEQIEQLGNGDAEKRIAAIHDNLVKSGYQVPDIETFKQDIKDPKKLKAVHENLIKEKYQMPDFNTFQSDLGIGSEKKNSIPNSKPTANNFFNGAATPQPTSIGSPSSVPTFNDLVLGGNAPQQEQPQDINSFNEGTKRMLGGQGLGMQTNEQIAPKIKENFDQKGALAIQEQRGIIHKENKEKGITTTAKKRIIAKGGNPEDKDTLNSEKEDVKNAINQGVLKYNPSTKTYQRDAGVVEGFLRGLNRNVLNASYGLTKGINAAFGGDNSEKEKQQAAELEAADRDPYGSFAHSFNIFKTDEDKRLLEVAKKTKGDELNYEGLIPSAGGLISDIAYFNPTTGVGNAMAKIPSLLAKGGTALAMGYAKNYGAKSNELYQQLKNDGYSDEDAAHKASVDATLQAIPHTMFEAALFGGAIPHAKPAENFMGAIGKMAKRTAVFSALNAPVQLGDEAIKAGQGYDTDGWQGRVKSAVFNGMGMVALMEGLPIILSLPKYAQSAMKEYANSPTIRPLVDKMLDSDLAKGSLWDIDGIRKKLDDYKAATDPLRGIVPDDKMASIGGLQEKRNNVQAVIDGVSDKIKALETDKKSAPALAASFDDKISTLQKFVGDKQGEIDAIDKKIKTFDKVDNPLDHEVDDETGEPVNPNAKKSFVEEHSPYSIDGKKVSEQEFKTAMEDKSLQGKQWHIDKEGDEAILKNAVDNFGGKYDKESNTATNFATTPENVAAKSTENNGTAIQGSGAESNPISTGSEQAKPIEQKGTPEEISQPIELSPIDTSFKDQPSSRGQENGIVEPIVETPEQKALAAFKAKNKNPFAKADETIPLPKINEDGKPISKVEEQVVPSKAEPIAEENTADTKGENTPIAKKNEQGQLISEQQTTTGSLDGKNQDNSQKITRPKGNRTPKSRRKIKNPLYHKALDIESPTLRQQVLQHFISGAKISDTVIKELFGGKGVNGDKKIQGEVNSRIGIRNKNGYKTIDSIIHSIYDIVNPKNAEFDRTELYSEMDIKNEVESVLQSYNGTRGMVDEIIGDIDKQDNDLKERAEYYEQLHKENELGTDDAIGYMEHLTDEQIKAISNETTVEDIKKNAIKNGWTDLNNTDLENRVIDAENAHNQAVRESKEAENKYNKLKSEYDKNQDKQGDLFGKGVQKDIFNDAAEQSKILEQSRKDYEKSKENVVKTRGELDNAKKDYENDNFIPFSVDENGKPTSQAVKYATELVQHFFDYDVTDYDKILNATAKEYGYKPSEIDAVMKQGFEAANEATAVTGTKDVKGIIEHLKEQYKAKGLEFETLENGDALLKKAGELDGVDYVNDTKGEALGFIHDKKIYLNAEKLNPKATFEETGHLWFNILEKTDKALFDKGIELITKEDNPYYKEVVNSKFYTEQAAKLGLKGDAATMFYAKEAMGKAIADAGNKFGGEAKKGFKEWLQNLWTNLKTTLGFKDVDINSEDFAKMTLNEYAKRAAKDMLEGTTSRDDGLLKDGYTSAKRRVYDAERESEGKLVADKDGRSGAEIFNKAADDVASGKVTTANIEKWATDIAQGNTPKTDIDIVEQQAFQLHHKVTLEKEYGATLDLFNEAKKEGNLVNMAKYANELSENEAKRELNYVANTYYAGVFNKIGLLRQLYINKEYNAISIRKAIEKITGEKVDDATVAKLEKMEQDLRDTNKELEVERVSKQQALDDLKEAELLLEEYKKNGKIDGKAKQDKITKVVNEHSKSKLDGGHKNAKRENVLAKLRSLVGKKNGSNAANEGNIQFSLDGEKLEGVDRNVLKQHFTDLIESYVTDESAPLTDVNEITNQIHNDIVDIFPQITKPDIHEIVSDYGVQKIPKGGVDAVIRDIKAQMLILAKTNAAETEGAVEKTGYVRDKPSDKVRELSRSFNNALQKLGIKRQSEQQISSKLDAIKTRLKNRISDLDRYLKGGEKPTKADNTIFYDDDANALKAERDNLQAQVDEMEKNNGVGAAEKIKAYEKSLDKRIQDVENELKTSVKNVKAKGEQPTSDAIEIKKAKLDALKKERAEVFPKSDAEINKAKLKALQTRLDKLELLKLDTPEKIDAYIESKKKVVREKDKAYRDLENKFNAKKVDIDNILSKHKFEKMPSAYKFFYKASQLYKSSLISDAAIYVKIFGSIGWKMLEVIPSASLKYGAYKTAKGLSYLGAKKPFEVLDKSLAETPKTSKDLANYVATFYKGMADKQSWMLLQNARNKGQSYEKSIDKKNNKWSFEFDEVSRKRIYESFAEANKQRNRYFALSKTFMKESGNTVGRYWELNARMHGSAKDIPAKAMFDATQELIYTNQIRSGMTAEQIQSDLNSEFVRQEAHRVSQRIKFAQDNFVTKLGKAGEKVAEREGFYKTQFILNALQPIVKIASNIQGEALRKDPMWGLTFLLKQNRVGDKSNVEHDAQLRADNVMRAVANLGVGAGAYLLGYYLSHKSSPLYGTKAAKENEDDVEEGSALGLWKKISHSPTADMIRIGATDARTWQLVDEANKKAGKETSYYDNMLEHIITHNSSTIAYLKENPFYKTSENLVKDFKGSDGKLTTLGKHLTGMGISAIPGSQYAKKYAASGEDEMLKENGFKDLNDAGVKFKTGVELFKSTFSKDARQRMIKEKLKEDVTKKYKTPEEKIESKIKRKENLLKRAKKISMLQSLNKK